MTVYGDMNIQELSNKMRNPNEDVLLIALDKMEKIGLIEKFTKDNDSRFRTPKVRYSPKEYSEFKDYDAKQLGKQLKEEFLYSYRMVSLLKSIFGKLIHYICDFYINRMQSATIDIDILKKELRYDTSIPRIGFVSRDEYEIYKNRFLEFENSMIEEMLERRKKLGIETPNIEYIIANLIIPIKKVIEHK